MRSTPLLLVLSLCLMDASRAVGAAPATGPATHPVGAPADAWLDAAREDLLAMVKQPPAKGLPNEFELAMMLVGDRGNESDRALLRDLLAQIRQRGLRGKNIDDQAHEASIKMMTAGIKLLLGELGAAEAVADARRLIEQLPEEGWGRWIHSMGLSWAVAGSGDYELAIDIADNANRTNGYDDASVQLQLAPIFAASTRTDLRDRALQDAMKIAKAMPEPTDDDSRRDSTLLSIAQAQAKLRLLNEAMATAGMIITSWMKCDAYVAVAEAAAADGDQATVERALSLALRGFEGGRFSGASFFNQVARAAERLDAREVFLTSAAVTEARLDERDELYIAPSLARGYAAFDLANDYRRLVERTKAAIAAFPAAEEQRKRSEAMLHLASAHARAGEHERVDALIAEAAMSPDELSVSDHFSKISTAYVAAGEYQRALAITEAHLKPEDRRFDYSKIAEAAARTGQFDLALDVAGRMKDDFSRQRVYRFTARAQAKAGQSAVVAEWVKHLESARTRAVVRLGVAEQLLGVRPHMQSGLYKE